MSLPQPRGLQQRAGSCTRPPAARAGGQEPAAGSASGRPGGWGWRPGAVIGRRLAAAEGPGWPGGEREQAEPSAAEPGRCCCPWCSTRTRCATCCRASCSWARRPPTCWPGGSCGCCPPACLPASTSGWTTGSTASTRAWCSSSSRTTPGCRYCYMEICQKIKKI